MTRVLDRCHHNIGNSQSCPCSMSPPSRELAKLLNQQQRLEGGLARILGNKFYNSQPRTRAIMTSSTETIESCKANAARSAVDDHIQGDCVIGIGSGSTMQYVLKRLKQRCHEAGIAVKCIPTSFQSKQLIHDYDLPVAEIDPHTIVDLTIDGADEVDENFVAIKGGGACLAQEKVIAFAAKKFIIVADFRKDSKCLGDNWTKGIPIEVLPMACGAVRQYIANKFDVEFKDLPVRIGREKAGPVITDNGNFVIDWKFKQASDFNKDRWKDLADTIKLIPGVVETGIFADMISAAYFGQEDGSVIKRIP